MCIRDRPIPTPNRAPSPPAQRSALVFLKPNAPSSDHRASPRRSEFSATETRLLRAAVAAFLDLLNLSTRTLEQFGSVEATAA